MSLQRRVSDNFSEMTSFIGTEIGDLTSEIAEKAPRSSTHVVTVSWSWSPMHSHCSEYRIATDKKREAGIFTKFLGLIVLGNLSPPELLLGRSTRVWKGEMQQELY